MANGDMTVTALILNGPNLNMLGVRQPEIYGRQTLKDIEAMCATKANTLGLTSDFRQSNFEGELIGWLHEARGAIGGVIINGAGLTHTSIALMDTLMLMDCPVVEVHLSNIHRREAFRHVSYISKAATGSIAGFGANTYLLALDALAAILAEAKEG